MKCGVSNEAKFHEKVSFVDPGPNATHCKKFLCCTGRAFQEVPCCTSHGEQTEHSNLTGAIPWKTRPENQKRSLSRSEPTLDLLILEGQCCFCRFLF